MTTSKRIWLAVGVLGIALAVQTGLQAHMMFGPTNSYPELRKPLVQLPMVFETERKDEAPLAWGFVTSASEKDTLKKLPFVPLEMVYRRGRSPALNVDVECYIVHSQNGEDRKHHPEICTRDVQQIPEDPAGREIIFLGGDPKRPVQRFSFLNGPAQSTTVYYFHYTILPEEREGQSWLQRLHQMYGRNPPSMTVQVTTNAGRDRWPLIEQDLIATLDRKLRSDHLPDGVRMGCDRLPIGIAPK